MLNTQNDPLLKTNRRKSYSIKSYNKFIFLYSLPAIKYTIWIIWIINVTNNTINTSWNNCKADILLLLIFTIIKHNATNQPINIINENIL